MEKTHKDLIVWQEAMNLIEMIYRETKLFPKEEMYGMVSQMRRSAVSVAANIAEGNGRRSRREYHHFLEIANGSLLELETHILIAERVLLLQSEASEQLQTQLRLVGRLLGGLMKSLTQNP
ncbi:MAG: four helix bundle protein [Spirochaetaceae bacterium]|nr:four helix bundle protein [Spirochaetaceae bacterium]